MSINDILTESARCSRCGRCRSVCPVFAVTKNEIKVARGRIAVSDAFVNRRLDKSDKLIEAAHSCLLCMRCSEVCASGVKIDTVIPASRAELKGKISTLLEGIIFGIVMQNRTLYDAFISITAVISRLYRFFTPANKQLIQRHLPLFWFQGKVFPMLSGRTALSALPSHWGPDIEPKTASVLIFTGCLTNAADAEVIRLLTEQLQELKVEFYIPKDQLCCGTPVLYSGDYINAKKLIARNMQLFFSADVDFIITPCASCKRFLKTVYPKFLTDSATNFKPVLEASEFLAQFDTKAKSTDAEVYVQAKKKIRIAYHRPCHIGDEFSIESIKKLISVYGEYVPTETENECCGGGGLFSVKYSKLADAIIEKKINELSAKNIDVVLSNCPGCVFQLRSAFAKRGIRIISGHPVLIRQIIRNI